MILIINKSINVMFSSLLINKTTKVTRGFTLLETLTSIAIITFVIIGPLTIIINSSSYAKETKNTIIATYLAEEAIELLQNQYDSLYVFCKKQPSDALCTTTTSETPGQIAWRVFKDRFGSGGGQSCYLKQEDGVTPDNPNGCSYDFQNMAGDITISPTRYVSTASECQSVIGVSMLSGGSRYMYTCKGVPAHQLGGTLDATKLFQRSVTIDWLPTFETGTRAEQYNDDLRIVARVTFRGYNGLSHTVTVTRFMHAQP